MSNEKKDLDKRINDACKQNGFTFNQNLLNDFGNFVLINNMKMRSSNDVGHCVNKYMEQFTGGKNDLPPKGYVRITGAENKSDWNELVKVEDIDKRIAQIMSNYPHEDAYYTDLKFFWLMYDDGKEEQMCDRAWSKNDK